MSTPESKGVEYAPEAAHWRLEPRYDGFDFGKLPWPAGTGDKLGFIIGPTRHDRGVDKCLVCRRYAFTDLDGRHEGSLGCSDPKNSILGAAASHHRTITTRFDSGWFGSNDPDSCPARRPYPETPACQRAKVIIRAAP